MSVLPTVSHEVMMMKDHPDSGVSHISHARVLKWRDENKLMWSCGLCGGMLRLPHASVFRLEWASRTAYSTLFAAMFTVFVAHPIGAPVAAEVLVQVMTVVATFVTLGPCIEQCIYAMYGCFIAAILSSITNNIFNGEEIGSGFAMTGIAFFFAIFEFPSLAQRLGLGVAAIAVLSHVQNPVDPNVGFRYLLSVVIGAIISILAVITPCWRSSTNILKTKIDRAATLTCNILDIQLKILYKAADSPPYPRLSDEDALRHSYRGSRSLLASDKLPQPPPPPPARLKSSPTLHDQKGSAGSINIEGAEVKENKRFDIHAAHMACRGVLIVQEKTLLGVLGNLLSEIRSEIGSYAWEPFISEKLRIFKHNHETLGQVYAVLNHSIRLSQKELLPHTKTTKDFLETLKPSLKALTKELKNTVKAMSEIQQSELLSTTRDVNTKNSRSVSKIVRRLRQSFSDLMERYYKGRTDILYNSGVDVTPQVLEDLTHLNFFLYTIRNLAKTTMRICLRYKKKPADKTPRSLSEKLKEAWVWILGMMEIFYVPCNLKPNGIKNAFKVSIAIMLSSLLVLVPEWRKSFDNAFWGPLTIAFVMGKSVGASFVRSLLRMQGTVTGVILGYTLLRLSNGNEIAILLVLPIIVFFASLAKPSEQYGYAGVVAAFTAGIIVLGFEDTTLDLEDYALARIELTAIGILIWFYIVVFVFPFDTRLELRKETIKSVATISRWIRKLNACAQEVENVTYPVPELGRLRDSISIQWTLLEDARSSPNLLSTPFPAKAAQSVLNAMVKIKRCLDALTRVAAEWNRNKLARLSTDELISVHRCISKSLQHVCHGDYPHPFPEDLKNKMDRAIERLIEKFRRIVSEVLSSSMKQNHIERPQSFPGGLPKPSKTNQSEQLREIKEALARAVPTDKPDTKTSNPPVSTRESKQDLGMQFGAGHAGATRPSVEISRRSLSLQEAVIAPRNLPRSQTTRQPDVSFERDSKTLRSNSSRMNLPRELPKFRNMEVMVYASYLFHLRHLVELTHELSEKVQDVLLQDELPSERLIG
ncbi:hypothetical protein AAMO2058_000708700 [Amorphochlora amoebiformis]